MGVRTKQEFAVSGRGLGVECLRGSVLLPVSLKFEGFLVLDSNQLPSPAAPPTEPETGWPHCPSESLAKLRENKSILVASAFSMSRR